MKIYNKKGFWMGIFWIIFGGTNTYLTIYRGMTLLDIVFCVLELGIGIYYITRSLSRNMSDADQDERTQLIVQKSRTAAYAWVKILCIILGILYLMVFNSTKNDLHLGMFVCFMMILVGMMIIEGICEIYYDHKL